MVDPASGNIRRISSIHLHAVTELHAFAYKKERTAARRLARASSLSEAAALQQILQSVAKDRDLSALLAARRQEQDRARDKMAAKRQAQQAARALKTARKQPPTDAWLAWFDGSSHPNPGRMGIGALLQSPDGKILEVCCRAGDGDSSTAEYLALNAVLDAAIKAQAERLIVYGDSQVVIDDICGRRRPAVALAAQRERAASLLTQLGEVSLVWIPRHQNHRADALSQQAVRSASTPGTHHTPADRQPQIALSVAAVVAAPGETQ